MSPGHVARKLFFIADISVYVHGIHSARWRKVHRSAFDLDSYILPALGTDRSLFRNVSVRDPRYNSDHYMVVELLRGGTTRDHIRYIAGRRRMPLTPPKEPTREDTLFGYLQRAVPKLYVGEQHRNAWISDETWKLVDERVSVRREPRAQTKMQRLGRAIQASLTGDRRRRVEEAGKAVEALIGEDPPNAKEAWWRMKGWYQATAKRGPPPAQATLKRITAERTELYSQVPSPGGNIPVTVEPAKIDDSVSTEDETAAAVKNLSRNRSGEPSRIRTEHLKGWLAAAKRGGWRRRRGRRKQRRRRREKSCGEKWWR